MPGLETGKQKRIFFPCLRQNPNPGLFAVMHPLTYAETLIDYHLCSHPKYKFTKESRHGSSIPVTQKQFLHHTVMSSPGSLAEWPWAAGRGRGRGQGHSWNCDKGLPPQLQNKDGNTAPHTASPKGVQVETPHRLVLTTPASRAACYPLSTFLWKAAPNVHVFIFQSCKNSHTVCTTVVWPPLSLAPSVETRMDKVVVWHMQRSGSKELLPPQGTTLTWISPDTPWGLSSGPSSSINP